MSDEDNNDEIEYEQDSMEAIDGLRPSRRNLAVIIAAIIALLTTIGVLIWTTRKSNSPSTYVPDALPIPNSTPPDERGKYVLTKSVPMEATGDGSKGMPDRFVWQASATTKPKNANTQFGKGAFGSSAFFEDPILNIVLLDVGGGAGGVPAMAGGPPSRGIPPPGLNDKDKPNGSPPSGKPDPVQTPAKEPGRENDGTSGSGNGGKGEGSGGENSPGKNDPDSFAEYLKTVTPPNSVDMGIKMCGSADFLYISATRLPDANQTIIPSKNGTGYCIKTCDAARRKGSPLADKFLDGVNYELKLWIDVTTQNSAGYAWYCLPHPTRPEDGVGWAADSAGMYQRRLLTPHFMTVDTDPFLGTYGPNTGGASYYGWNMCSNPSLPVPPQEELGNMPYKYDGGSGHSTGNRWTGLMRYTQSGKDGTWSIGLGVKNYTLVDFQMVGKYCYWVGHDDYFMNNEEDNGSKADNNFHGNFTKVKLQGSCPKDWRPPDYEVTKKTVQLQLTPGGLSCYYCPKLHEWNERTRKLETYDTFLRGSEIDGYVCARKCPAGTLDHMSGTLHNCVPVGISILPELPTIEIET